MLAKNDVVQFNECHKWCGSYGYIESIHGSKIMVAVPVPEKGTAYIFCTERDLVRIGVTELVAGDSEER